MCIRDSPLGSPKTEFLLSQKSQIERELKEENATYAELADYYKVCLLYTSVPYDCNCEAKERIIILSKKCFLKIIPFYQRYGTIVPHAFGALVLILHE